MEDKAVPQVQRDQRAFADIVDDYQEKAGYDFVRDADPGVTSGVWDQEIGAWADAHTLKSLFFSDDWVFIITDLVANKISSQPLMVMEKSVASNISAVQPAEDHELNQLIYNPNDLQGYTSWMYNVVVELILLGNSMVWHEKRRDKLLTLAGENITLDFDEKCRLKQYLYGVGDCEQGSGHTSFPADQIIHVRRPNPSSLYWGLSPYIPGRQSILFNRYSQEYLNSFYLKQATPGLALKLDKQVNEDVALRQLRTFELAYSGRRNARRTLILPKGVSAETLTHTLSDQKLVEMIDKNREIIINLLKIPKHELSLQKVGSLGSEEHRLALRNFWEATIIPTMRLIEGSLNQFFRKRLGENYFLKFNITDVDALQEDKLAKAQLAKELLDAGWTVNEVRTELFSKEPSDDPDADLPYNMVQLVRNAPSTNTSSEPVAEAEQSDGDGETTEGSKGLLSKYSSFHELSQKSLDQELSGKINPIISDTLDLFAAMAAVTIDEVMKFDQDKYFTQFEHKTRKRSLLNSILDGLRQLKDDWVGPTTEKLTDTMESGYDLQVSLVFNEKNKRDIEAIRADRASGRRKVLEGRVKDTFDGLTKARTEEVMDIIQEGITNNRPVGEISRDILSAYGPGTARWKAERIARTEVLTASSIGQWEAFEDAKKVIPGIRKMWMTAGDERVRDSHIALDQKDIAADATFGNGLRFPRDPMGSANEVVNCRCTLVTIIPEDTGV